MSELQNEPDIILYGGSFDPPHKGHEKMFSLLRLKFPKAEIWAVVSPNSAGAEGVHKTHQAGVVEREEMLKLTLKEMAEDIFMSDIEKKSPHEINYSYKTVGKIGEQFPKKKLALAVGQDQFSTFDRWKNPEQILERASLIAVARSGSKRTLREDTLSLAKKMKLDLVWNSDEEASLGGQTVHVLEENICEASSVEIRECFQKGKKIPDSWMEKNVREYIDSHKLYIER